MARMARCCSGGLALFIVFSVRAQLPVGGWQIRALGQASPVSPFVRVEVWAWFDDPSGFRDAFGSGDLDVIAGSGVFRDPVVEIMAHQGASAPLGVASAGVVAGSGVVDVFVGQVFGAGGLVGSPDNPILVWSALWGTGDFTPRSVDLHTTGTSAFWIGVNDPHGGGPGLNLYPDQFFHGSGSIQVIPAPAGVGLLVIGVGVIARRRRL